MAIPPDGSSTDARDVHGTSTVTPVGGGAAPVAKKTNWLPWVLAALGLLALLFLLSRCNSREPVATTTATTTTTTTAPAVPAAAPAAPAAGTVVGQTETVSIGTLGTFLAGTDAAPRTFVFDNLNFDTAKADIRPADQVTVDEVAGVLNKYPTTRIRVVGYADSRGSEPANVELGARRAEAVKAALVAKGVTADRIETASGGESAPVATNATAQGEAENRRTELVVVSR